DGAQGLAFRGQDSLRRFENFQQLPEPDRAHRREHIERDAGFRGGHGITGSTESRPTKWLGLPNQNGISSSSGPEGAAFGGGAGRLDLEAPSSSPPPLPPPRGAPSICIFSPMTFSLVRFCPDCLSSQESS